MQAKAHKSFDTWHRAFHGTNAEYVAPILEVGHLLVPGDAIYIVSVDFNTEQFYCMRVIVVISFDLDYQ